MVACVRHDHCAILPKTSRLQLFYCYAVRLMSPRYGMPHDPIVAVARKTTEFIFLCVCCKAYLFFTVQCPSNA